MSSHVDSSHTPPCPECGSLVPCAHDEAFVQTAGLAAVLLVAIVCVGGYVLTLAILAFAGGAR